MFRKIIHLLLLVLLAACASVKLTPTSTPTPATPTYTPSPSSLPPTATPEPALSPFPATLADFEKYKLQFAACFNTPDAAGACAPYDAALQKSLESFSWFPTTGTPSEQYAAMSANNKGEYLAVPTNVYAYLVSNDGFIERGLPAEIIDDKFFGILETNIRSNQDPSKNKFERWTTNPDTQSIYKLFGFEIVIPRNMLVQPVFGNLGPTILLPGANKDYAIATIVMPDGKFISAGVVNFKDGVQYEMRDRGDSLVDLKGFPSIQITTKINSQSNKGEIDITRDMLEWLIKQDAYMQAQSSDYYMQGVKEWDYLIIEDRVYDEMLKWLDAQSSIQEDIATFFDILN